MTILQKICELPDKLCPPPPPPACEKPVICEDEKVDWKDKCEKPVICEDEKVNWKDKGDNYGREGKDEGEKYAKNGDDCIDDKPVCKPVCKPKCEEEETCKQPCEEEGGDMTAALASLPDSGGVDYASDHLDLGAPFDMANFDTPDTYDLAA